MKELNAHEKRRQFEGREGVIRDLEILCDGPSIQLHFGFDGALIAVRSGDQLVFHRTFYRDWNKVSTRKRGQAILKWIHKAARRCRNLDARRTRRKKKGVA